MGGPQEAGQRMVIEFIAFNLVRNKQPIYVHAFHKHSSPICKAK